MVQRSGSKIDKPQELKDDALDGATGGAGSRLFTFTLDLTAEKPKRQQQAPAGEKSG